MLFYENIGWNYHFSPFHKASSKLVNASRFAVPIQWYYSIILSFQLCINQFAD